MTNVFVEWQCVVVTMRSYVGGLKGYAFAADLDSSRADGLKYAQW